MKTREKKPDNGTGARYSSAATDSTAAASRAERLKTAIKAAGGKGFVSERTHIPLSTLGRYQTGGDIPSEALVALADVCGVSVEWLAAGRGPQTLPEVDRKAAIARSQIDTAFPPSPGQWDRDVGVRVQQAVQLGGGAAAVAERSGVSADALSQFAQGRPMPIATMACVAQATGVSLDWLATGNGSPTPFAQGAPPASGMAAPTPGGPRPPPAIGRLNPLVLAKAMEVVEALSPTERGTLSMLERARRVIHVYELLITPEEDLPPLPMVPSASGQGGL